MPTKSCGSHSNSADGVELMTVHDDSTSIPSFCFWLHGWCKCSLSNHTRSQRSPGSGRRSLGVRGRSRSESLRRSASYAGSERRRRAPVIRNYGYGAPRLRASRSRAELERLHEDLAATADLPQAQTSLSTFDLGHASSMREHLPTCHHGRTSTGRYLIVARCRAVGHIAHRSVRARHGGPRLGIRNRPERGETRVVSFETLRARDPRTRSHDFRLLHRSGRE